MSARLSRSSIVEQPVKNKPEIDLQALPSLKTSPLEDSHVYVHCHFHNGWFDLLIRVWKTTFLIDQSSSTRSALVHVENISYAPEWTPVPGGEYSFLLVFSALPKSCAQFDLLEVIPQPGGFYIPNIQRNENDVYHVKIF